MRISHKRRPERIELNYRINEEIQAPRFRVVDETGNFLGVMERAAALNLAREQEKDLIEIVPKGDIPVVKITDYGKFKYQKEKEIKKQKSRQKKIEVKGIRLSLRIGAHDIDLRLKQALRFLEEGNKVKIEIILRGREKSMFFVAREIMNNFINQLGKAREVKIEQALTRQPNGFFLIAGAK